MPYASAAVLIPGKRMLNDPLVLAGLRGGKYFTANKSPLEASIPRREILGLRSMRRRTGVIVVAGILART